MSRVPVLFVVLLVLAVVISGAFVLAGYPASLPLVVAAVVVLVIVGVLARSRPERAALVLAVAVVVTGLGFAGAQVAAGIDDRQVDFHGRLDIKDFSYRNEKGRDLQATEGYAYLSSVEGDMTKLNAGTRDLVMWSLAKLAPWLLAAIVLVLVFPILRAAGRGDPFWSGAAWRLNAIGVLLLLGIPGVAILQFQMGQGASAGVAIDPFPTPELTISITQLLPGVLVLALVGIFRRGVALRELERHTI